MRCIPINGQVVVLILLSLLLKGVKQSQTDEDVAKDKTPQAPEKKAEDCPSNVECTKLGGACIDCEPFDYNSCIYGEKVNVTCRPKENVDCISNNAGNKSFERTMVCQFCYQTEPWEHKCTYKANCKSVGSPRFKSYYRTNCSVNSDIICFGNRNFEKNVPCNWTGGYRWSTALLLSITLGGFGADRFYLGHWQEGIGKLFSFGGLGVWTLIDVILISLHYLGPDDGSLYI
ncbi:TM2 domain-containing protein almondex [Schistocerca americana]|uniref:TM2 domain-containing protein almondex n=1 Tax=Schistocerca americana TaxID=7009 RepID=UPI001F4FF158|nr:TM2 domain-containing protein almondex [Schistocerca americana]XP_047116997.1 TM2 domain-containing protein almondex isoform X1 [Schistocerca piceifrons]XP_049788176.1 TM2 domain-containing protein almondex [Schistocerca cancellata]XP_049964146.1 TM2 domain-containing protein almondex isoform X1 [Schistocerca serialis cubense]